MLEEILLYVVVENDEHRSIHAVCRTVEEAERVRDEILAIAQAAVVPGLYPHGLSIYAMKAVFPGDRYRLVFGAPQFPPVHPLDVPAFQYSKITYTDLHSEAYLYPDELYIHRKEALAAAARHNYRQLLRNSDESRDWAVVVEIGEPLWRRYRSECLVRQNTGWEEAELVRPVRVVYPTPEETALPEQEIHNNTLG